MRAINKHYLKTTRPPISQLLRDVQADCLSAGLKPPHRCNIVARLEDVDLRKRARRCGEHKIEKATTAVRLRAGHGRHARSCTRLSDVDLDRLHVCHGRLGHPDRGHQPGSGPLSTTVKQSCKAL